MGLELVSGGKGGETDTGQGIDRLAQAERMVAEARLRLSALVDRLADLRRRVGTGSVSPPPGDAVAPAPSFGSPST